MRLFESFWLTQLNVHNLEETQKHDGCYLTVHRLQFCEFEQIFVFVSEGDMRLGLNQVHRAFRINNQHLEEFSMDTSGHWLCRQPKPCFAKIHRAGRVNTWTAAKITNVQPGPKLEIIGSSPARAAAANSQRTKLLAACALEAALGLRSTSSVLMDQNRQSRFSPS